MQISSFHIHPRRPRVPTYDKHLPCHFTFYFFHLPLDNYISLIPSTCSHGHHILTHSLWLYAGGLTFFGYMLVAPYISTPPLGAISLGYLRWSGAVCIDFSLLPLCAWITLTHMTCATLELPPLDSNLAGRLRGSLAWTLSSSEVIQGVGI